jgi:hypothetical protein
MMNEYRNNKKKQEREVEQKFHNEFNSITNKVKPENQNQQHNVRQEGIGPKNQQR